MELKWWSNESLQNQLIEGVCQMIFWFIALTPFGKWVSAKSEGKDWFENRVAKQPGGKDEFVVFVRVFPQHFVSAILIWLGINFNNNNIFRTALLAEFGYEVVDLVRLWYLYFGGYMQVKSGRTVFRYMTLHHLPGILTIIPGNLCCSDDPLFQEIPWCLLSVPWITIILMTLCKLVDLTDIHERAPIKVWYTLSMT
eukprot:UN06412